ncbi:LLM class flavin-dependent oxidoreductase [Lacisediminihabitans changchengi]|uniref:LLM class flavin-dependent oxidoreductase n=1 Tax=Lacisediminihabitans changchengi TaxID=2787634 RepID=A0A934SJS0_9MICO|nr:LLM class flavin-dependent oxidoreductase [Lacisediminihabitans changchengi]MBK4346182.1 LLM class flavin-dependent oxidoreductase [Lacisediminihabitans changchengi]
MRFGIVILPQQPWTDARRLWVSAETLGFDHAWTYDHLSWRSLADEPWGATIPTLTAAATATSTIRLGTFVASPNFRHPVTFAKDIATLDDIAGGRFILGVGSGGTGFDAYVLGYRELSPKERYERFAEFVTQLDALLRFETDGPISLDGDWFTAHEARMVGVPAQLPRVPFVMAANGPKALALTARYGQGWVTTGRDGATGEEWWESVRELSSRLDDTGSSVDRYLSLDSGGQYALESVAAFDDLVGRAEHLGFTDVITHWPRESGIYAGSESVLDAVAARIAELREAQSLGEAQSFGEAQ